MKNQPQEEGDVRGGQELIHLSKQNASQTRIGEIEVQHTHSKPSEGLKLGKEE